MTVKGKILGRKALEQFGTLFTPDTLLRWHRMLVAQKWDYSDRTKKKPGRPRIRQAIVDFTTVEVWTKCGLVTYYLLFVMELKTRRVHFAGCTTNPQEAWMKQVARELTNDEDGFLKGKRYLIMDRDSKFSESFRSFLNDQDVKPVRLPPRSPNMNAHLERFFGSLKSECLNRLILFGEKSLRNAVSQFLFHYHTERPHQGLGNELIVPLDHPPVLDAKIETTERLGGLLRSYRRAA